jgi:3-oxoadipate enol-lactonase/3-oxoadipate enol-lactonase/4-carboxymuconolactone decarboxylase
MPVVERQGRRIHYSRAGDGPSLVLIPGLGSGARLFGTLPRRFARNGFTCAAIDPVGLEPSSPLPGGIFDFTQAAHDVLAVAKTLPKPVTLVGTSLGGKVALCAASMHNDCVDKLVMLCSSAIQTARSKRVYRWFELLCTEIDGKHLGELTAPFLFGETFLTQKAGVVDNIIRSTKPSAESRAFMQTQARALQSFDGQTLCPQISVPTLCLAGSEDTLTLPHEVVATAAMIPNAQHHCFAGAGHSLLLESAQAFDHVTEFARPRS